MTTITLYDSDTAADIPDDAEAVAGYVDGTGPDIQELERRFPGKPVVTITRASPPMVGARVADSETGALSAAEAAVWARNEIELGRRPTLYYSRLNVKTIGAALTGANVLVAAVDFWVADWTGEAHLLEGTVATQYASPTVPIEGQGHYDLSEAEQEWLAPSITGPQPPANPPPSPPAPPNTGAAFMPPTISTGHLSPAVRSAQALLNLHNGQLDVDGDFGPETETAVRNYQTIMGLAVDGIVGPETWTSLCTNG